MALPPNARQLIVTKLGNKFREVTELQTKPLKQPGSGQVVVKTKFVGINASDIIYTSGGYDPNHVPPFIAGLEGIGEIAAVGPDVGLKVGQAVVILQHGCFADYVTLSEKNVVPVPSEDPSLMSIVLSGLTASISLEKEGDLKAKKKVLVTAAAGGTGQFAVQIAKLAGCHVIGTTSSAEKAAFLKDIGCDRVINYKSENVDDVLGKEYPFGIDVIYECVGKEMFDICVNNLAEHGRLIVIGQISAYERTDPNDQSEMVSKIPVAMKILRKSASLRGFFLGHYLEDFPRHVATLVKYYAEGKLKIGVDKGEHAENGPFVGIERLADAVDYMYSRKNIGKVVVQMY